MSLSIEEQLEAIKSILGTTAKRKPKAKTSSRKAVKAEKIDISVLPDSLKHLVKES